jgi:xanthine dehydrogenase small subunit
MLPPLSRLHPALGRLVRRIGALQVRNSGTIGGNIANGSPIGDMPPALIALGATINLRRGEARRTLPLEAFFLAYKHQDLEPGEFVESVRIPRPDSQTSVHIFKLTKRFDSDISAVCGTFALTLRDNVVSSARIAFGGMAAIPKRALNAERVLIGRPWAESSIETAAQVLPEDFAPLTDVRGTSAYRMLAAQNLFRRIWREHETPGQPTLETLEAVHG